MLRRAILLLLACLLLAAVPGVTLLRAEDKEAKEGSSAFIDKDLSANWEGLMEYWRYKDGELVGQCEKLKSNTFLCSKKKYKDFEMTFKVRLEGGKGNSGVQIRSKIADKKTFAVAGPQCDIGE